MDNPIMISLVVSGIGMLMLFLALTLLYGLMYLMTALIKDQPADPLTDPPAPEAGLSHLDQSQRAAVIAVALARAEQDTSAIRTTETKEITSAWRALHHQRQLVHNTPARRTQ